MVGGLSNADKVLDELSVRRKMEVVHGSGDAVQALDKMPMSNFVARSSGGASEDDGEILYSRLVIKDLQYDESPTACHPLPPPTVAPPRCAVDFCPCIDIHKGKVKLIVGSTLRGSAGALITNFESEKSTTCRSYGPIHDCPRLQADMFTDTIMTKLLAYRNNFNGSV